MYIVEFKSHFFSFDPFSTSIVKSSPDPSVSVVMIAVCLFVCWTVIGGVTVLCVFFCVYLYL